jgi:TRAP-type uncharacterized transport system fused permease subunit
VLSEVSPPTALAPYAAAAITGANAFETMMRTWKYTLPAFIIPIAFTLNADGLGLLLQSSVTVILQSSVTAALGVTALAIAAGGRIKRSAHPVERGAAAVAGLLLVYPGTIEDVAGMLLLAAVLIAHLWRPAGQRV